MSNFCSLSLAYHREHVQNNRYIKRYDMSYDMIFFLKGQKTGISCNNTLFSANTKAHVLFMLK